MTYAVNQLIQESDYNALVTTVSSVYGVGSGEVGYGQSAISLVSSVSTADQVGSSQWKPLRDVIQVLADHQGTAVNLPPDPELDLDHLIKAYPDLLTASTDIFTNRHEADSGSMTLYTNLASTSFSSDWGSSISCTYDFVWTTEEKCRFFWNSGGQILLRLSYVMDAVSPRNTAWNSFVTDLGGFRIAWNQTRMIASYPGTQTSANLGYYGLPLTPTLLWQGYNTQGSYSFPTNNLAIYGWSVDGPQGANGDNGKHLRFRLDINDAATSGVDNVTGDWASSVDVSKATTYLSQETPTVTLDSAFAGS
jgi:hypothetical protein